MHIINSLIHEVSFLHRLYPATRNDRGYKRMVGDNKIPETQIWSPRILQQSCLYPVQYPSNDMHAEPIEIVFDPGCTMTCRLRLRIVMFDGNL